LQEDLLRYVVDLRDWYSRQQNAVYHLKKSLVQFIERATISVAGSLNQ